MTTESVAVLFTDLVGSTALLSRVGEERAEQLRREHFGLLREVLATTSGREIKNLGDGLMIVFAVPSEALRCAVAMQQQLERRNRSVTEEPLAIRVGLAFGEADVAEDDYFGPPVVEAARLCAHAETDQVLVTELIRAVTGSRGGFEFASLGAIDLKGIPDPVAVCEVRWERLAEEPTGMVLPLPERLKRATAFVGRTDEQALLNDLLKSAFEGERRAVLIGGEPGIGKTSLAREIANRAHAEGALVLYGRCDEDLGIPYQPWSEALSHLFDHLPEDQLRGQLGRSAARIATLVPEIPGLVEVPGSSTSADPEAERYLLFGDVVSIITSVAASAAVVLVLDDLHWADRATILMLRHIISNTSATRLLVVGTFRDSEVKVDHPLADALAALRREPGVERVALRGLDDSALLQLLEATAGHEMPEDGIALRDALARETDGNPFFVEEILRFLADTGAIRLGDDGRWFAAVDLQSQGLPASVREVIGQRVQRLGPEAVTVLTTAAVLGREFDLEILEAITDIDGDLLDVLDAATEASLIEEVAARQGRYAFLHGLVEHTLYDQLSSNRRARVHRRVAERLEEIYGEEPGERLGELAHHWSQSVVAVDIGKAISYSRRAAERALAQLAPDEAVRWYGHTLELVANLGVRDDELECRLLVGLGEAQRQAGSQAFRETLLRAAALAQRLGNNELLVQSALANTRGRQQRLTHIDTERIEVIHAALAVLDESENSTRAKLYAALTTEVSFGEEFATRLELVDAALSAARASNDPPTIAHVIAHTALAVNVPEMLDELLTRTEEASDIAARLGDPFLQWTALSVRARSLFDAGEIGTLDHCLAQMQIAADALGQPHPRWELAYVRAFRAMLGDDPGEAERLADEAFALGVQHEEADALTIFSPQLFAVRWQQGRVNEILPLIVDAANEPEQLPVFRTVLTWALAMTGAHDEARHQLADARADDFPIPYDPLWLSAMAMWSDVAAFVGDRESARLLYDRIAPWSTHLVNATVAPLGVVAHFQGRLAATLDDHASARQHYEMALDRHRGMRAPFFIANSALRFVQSLLLADEPDDAPLIESLVAEALGLAQAHGYAGLERELAALS